MTGTINLDKFKAWLVSRGAELLTTTNEWELVRFKSGPVASIIYTNKQGKLSYVGEANTAYKAYKLGESWRAMKPTIRKRSVLISSLLERDGCLCFYCLEPTTDEDRTREHLVAITHGGPDHISNMVLAHKVCNEKASHLSVREKISIHVCAVISQLDCT